MRVGGHTQCISCQAAPHGVHWTSALQLKGLSAVCILVESILKEFEHLVKTEKSSLQVRVFSAFPVPRSGLCPAAEEAAPLGWSVRWCRGCTVTVWAGARPEQCDGSAAGSSKEKGKRLGAQHL